MKHKIKNILLTTFGVTTLAFTVSCGATATATESTEVESQTEATTDTESESDNSETETEVGSTAYEYTDASGRTLSFEEAPENVVVDYLPLWESALMLGVTPVGAGGADNYLGFWKPFDGLDLSGTVDIGQKETNLEVVTTLSPDVILTQTNDLENPEVDGYDAIAPTAVFGNETKTNWRLSLREVGALLDLEEKAEEVIGEVDAILTEARANFDNQYQDETIIMTSLMSGDKLYTVYRDDLYDKETGLGLNTPEGFTTETKYTELPLENLVGMNPDQIFINVFPENTAHYEELQQNPLWQSLDAVQNDNVYVIDGPGHSISPMSTVYTINFIIDKLSQ
ncbi:MAG: ABC transporter substrate-binding protein [Lachnospirales bacterium]